MRIAAKDDNFSLLQIKYKIAMLLNKCLQGLAPRIWLSFVNQWLSLLDVGI